MQFTDNQASKQGPLPDLFDPFDDQTNTQNQIALVTLQTERISHRVHVDPGTDLNNEWEKVKVNENVTQEKIETDPSQFRDTGQWDKSSFSKEIYDALPTSLQQASNQLTTNTEREVFIVGALGVSSGLMPNILGHYDGRYIGTNLYAYILAPYGTGKGGLENARLLGAAVHQAKRDDYTLRTEAFYQKQQQYEKDKKAYQKNKDTEASPPVPPKSPPQLMLFIPANNSKSGLYQNLTENKERGIMIETEGDTLADAVKQDYAGFTDLLRNAFHHERCTFFRRGNGGEYVEVTRPFISLVLSSTFDQLKALIPTPENGLFSRFMFYEMKGTVEFRNVFDKRKRNYADYFDLMGKAFKKMYDYLDALEKPLYFDLTENQQSQFVQKFRAWKKELHEYVTKDLDGTVNRLGLICFRVAMVFTVLRAFDTDQKEGPFVCSDTDFENALRIVETLKIHAVRVYNKLPKSAIPADADSADEDEEKTKQKRACRKLFAEGMTNCREISIKVFGNESKKTTVYRWTH